MFSRDGALDEILLLRILFQDHVCDIVTRKIFNDRTQPFGRNRDIYERFMGRIKGIS